MYDGPLDANPDRLRTSEEASRFRTSSEVASGCAYAPSSLSPTDSAVKAATLAWGPAEFASCSVGTAELALLASGIAVAGLCPTASSAIFCASVLLLSIVGLRETVPSMRSAQVSLGRSDHRRETEQQERRSELQRSPAGRQCSAAPARQDRIGFVPAVMAIAAEGPATSGRRRSW